MSSPKFTAGPRVELQKYSSYRTLYPIYRDDVLFCFVGMRTGWGKAWQFYPLQIGGLSKERVDSFQPNNDKTRTSFASGDGLKGILEYLNEAPADRLTTQLGEHFKDANEVRAIEFDRETSRRKHVKNAVVNLKHGKAEAERKRDMLQKLLDRTELTLPYIAASLSTAERSILTEMVGIFDKEAQSYARMLEKIQTENNDVTIGDLID
jgi:hypothetical protein